MGSVGQRRLRQGLGRMGRAQRALGSSLFRDPCKSHGGRERRAARLDGSQGRALAAEVPCEAPVDGRVAPIPMRAGARPCGAIRQEAPSTSGASYITHGGFNKTGSYDATFPSPRRGCNRFLVPASASRETPECFALFFCRLSRSQSGYTLRCANAT